MSRDFTKDAANRLGWAAKGAGAIGALVSGAGAISWHCWAYMDSTTTTSGQNRLISTYINGTSNGIRWNVENTDGTRKLRGGGRSTTADSLQQATGTTDLLLSQWYSLGGVNNFTADTVTPYVGGSAEGGASVTFGASTYTPGTPTAFDAFGASDDSGTTSANASWDGRLAELCLWNIDITATGFAALAAGDHPLTINESNIVLYLPIFGDNSPEPDYRDKNNATITGSLPKITHPTVDASPQTSPRYIIQGGI